MRSTCTRASARPASSSPCCCRRSGRRSRSARGTTRDARSRSSTTTRTSTSSTPTCPDWDWVYGRSPQKSALTRFFREFLLEQKPDVVHFQHTMFLGYDILRVTRNTLPDVPIVYTLHEYLPICHRDGQMVRTTERRAVPTTTRRGAATSASRDISPADVLHAQALHPVAAVASSTCSWRPAACALERYVRLGDSARADRARAARHRAGRSRVPEAAATRDRATGSASSASSPPTRAPTCCSRRSTLLGDGLRRAPLDPRREPRHGAGRVPGAVRRDARGRRATTSRWSASTSAPSSRS